MGIENKVPQIYKLTSQSDFETSDTSSFVEKCKADGDLFVKEPEALVHKKVFHCPILDKNVYLNGSICEGPTDRTVCEHNRVI